MSELLTSYELFFDTGAGTGAHEGGIGHPGGGQQHSSPAGNSQNSINALFAKGPTGTPAQHPVRRYV